MRAVDLIYFLISRADDRDELLGFFHWYINVFAIGLDSHVDIREAFFRVYGCNIERLDIYPEFSKSGCNTGEYAYFVADSKCDLE